MHNGALVRVGEDANSIWWEMIKMEEDKEGVREGIGNSKQEKLCEKLKPYIYCIFAYVCSAGFNITSKVSLNKGMSRYVLVAYGHAIGTIATALLAFLFERKDDGKISLPLVRNLFFLGLLGAVFGRTLFYAGLEQTSPAFASALGNLIPSITFILAVLFRMEKLEISKRGSQAKILGTVVAFSGAALMTLYKGITVISLHAQHSHQPVTQSKGFVDKDSVKGSLMLLTSYVSLSAFYILQGVVIFGITVYVQTLAIRLKGPVFMTAFKPLSTLIVAIMGLLILGDALYIGGVIGATLIILGLYATLWGKEKEKVENETNPVRAS
ncbi:hypothetical protein ACB092_11G083600 [Castanea dentata]